MSAKKKAKFTTGAVTRITVSNFLVFTHFEMHPEPNLNLIIGPNGTGKSSLVNAIVLGLAGKPSVLGRASNIVDYIQYGKDKAELEVELCNEDGPNWIVHRTINRNGNSTWSINGKSSSLKNVEKLMSVLKIQVSNLCQFLPQDRVADFAKMTPIQLLQNTQKAAGEEGLFELHEELIQARSEAEKLEKDLQAGQENLEQEQSQHNRIKEQLKNNEERQKHLATVELLKKKLAWMEYQNAQRCFKEKKDEIVAKENELKALKKGYAPQEKHILTLKGKVETSRLKLSRLRDNQNYGEILGKLKTDFEERSETIADVKSEFQSKKQEEDHRLNRIESLTKQIELHEEQLRTCQQDNHSNQAKLGEVVSEIKVVTNDINGIQNNQIGLKAKREANERELRSIQSELTRLNDVCRQREEMLRHLNPEAYSALQWMREHKEQFSGKVYEPIMLNINLLDNRFAKYVESRIARRDMVAFAFEKVEDRELFLKEVYDKRNLRVNAVDVPKEPLSSFKPNYNLGNFKKWGFQGFLRDYFQAPDGIMRFLCKQNGVHLVPVGNQITEQNLESLMKENVPFKSFYTENRSIIIRTSKYNPSKRSTVSYEISPARLLATSANQSRISELENLFQNSRNALSEVEKQLASFSSSEKEKQRNLEALRTTMKKLNEDIKFAKGLEGRIRKEKENLDALTRRSVNLEEEEKKTELAIKCLIIQKAVLMKDYAHNVKHMAKTVHRRTLEAANQAFLQNKLTVAERKLADDKKALRDYEIALEAMRSEVKSVKNEAKRLLDVAKRVTGLRPEESLSQETKQLFEKYPNDTDEINQRIFQEQARADLLCPIDQSVIQECQTRVNKIARLESDIGRSMSRLVQLQTEIQNVKEKWLPSLETLVQKINKNFSRSFSKLKCVGEIVLDKSSNPEDYHKWGINIRVKFRDNEPLKELTPMYHSGGEQSVSTALYMLALQELTQVPFRCVDEINQGMDPDNERKVFDFITETACQKHNAQYFLLTPKLLPDLTYSENMKVFVIHNGPFFNCAKGWNIANFISVQKSLK